MFKRLILLGLMTLSPVAWSQTPDPLKSWEAWAAEPFSYRQCAIKPGLNGESPGQYVCQWPGKLELEIAPMGGRFSQSWSMEQSGSVSLPGSLRNWPRQVRVNGVLTPVVKQNDTPSVLLSPGLHTIQGQWSWDAPPSQMEIPISTAWWSVDGVDGDKVSRQGGVLLLSASPVLDHKPANKDSVNLRVFRKFIDAQAVQVQVLMEIDVGGSPRELAMGPVVDPDRWVPMGVESSWPVQWKSNGMLRVQAQPGQGQVLLSLRCISDCNKPFTRPQADASWPQVEYWALGSDPGFRIVSWDSPAIDPRQVAAPANWHDLPWVQVNQGASAGWSVKSRGPTDKDSAMHLTRTAWLDFDGQGWWLQDSIQGATPRSYRLVALPPYTIAAASFIGGEPLLVSKDEQGTTGVEWRDPMVAANILLRQPHRAPRVPISGIDGEFSTVDWTLHFPAAHRVLFAPGADQARGVWWNHWRLTQVLGVALLLLLSWRWGGLRALLPAGLLVLFAFHSPGMPAWSWGLALGLGLLARAGLPDKLQKVAMWAWYVSLATWLLLATSFAISQVKAAMYPQWAERSVPAYQQNTVLSGVSGSMESGVFNQMGDFEDMASSSSEPRKEISADSASMSAPSAPMVPSPPPRAIEENGATISAGPGVPQWSSPSPVTLSWQGPITPSDTIQLWVAGPFLVTLARWLSVALLFLVAWSLVRRPPLSNKPVFGRLRFPWKKAAAVSLLSLALPLVASAANITPSAPQAPSVSVLDRLGQQIHPIPSCAPGCVSISQAHLSSARGALVVEMEVHSQARAALPLPTDAEGGLVLSSIEQEGVAIVRVVQEGGQAWMEMREGVSLVRLVYMPRAASGALRFAEIPVQVSAQAEGWGFSGIQSGRLATGVLGWNKIASTTAAVDDRETRTQLAIPPFVVINRTIFFGPKWEARVQVVRMAPQEGAFVIAVPLLEGEQPSQDLPRNEAGDVVVSFGPAQDTVEWVSTLQPKTTLDLSAPSDTSRIERWTLQPGTRFRVSPKGMDSLSHNAWTFYPLPGETLSIAITEPTPVEGGTIAIDRASLTQQWGPRGQSVDLSLHARATTATDLVIEVPPGLGLDQVHRNGSPVPGSRIESGKLLLPAPPGQSSWDLRFKNDQAPSLWVSSPEFKFNAPLANLDIVHVPGAKRWILDTQGPGKAPAVAYWPWLVVLVVLAVILGRWRNSPLKTWQWVLLGLGFSVAAPWKIAVVGGWLVALDLRSRHSGKIHASPLFNLIQVALVAWTVLAIATIVGALPESLLASPDMKIYGEQSGRLTWFVDQVKSAVAWPQAVVVSVPIWVYRALMLSWALWLAVSALNWLRDGLRSWLRDGHWHKISLRARPVPNPAASHHKNPPED